MLLISKTILALGLILASTSAYAQEGTQIAYLPFGISTYAPVGRDSIKATAFITIALKHSPIPPDLLNLIKDGSTGPMNEGTIRLLITDGKTVYYFDQRGNGVRDSRFPVSIDPAEFEKLVSQLRICISMPGLRTF